MREILFRGKDIEGYWHIGLLARFGNAWYISNKAGIATAYEVIPDTVGQYTGLTDKNGTKIFEGDIIKCGRNRYAVIFNIQNLKYCISRHGWQDDLWAFGKNSTVIGNVHDNPELLEAENG